MENNSMHIVLPSKLLQKYINSYYLVELTGTSNTEEFEQKPISTGCEEMFIGYQDTINSCYTNTGVKTLFKSGIVGTHKLKNDVKGLAMEANQKTCKFVSIKFKPGGFYHIFKIPSNELYNSFHETTIVLGNEIDLFREKLAETTEYQERSKLLDLFFTQQLNKTENKNYHVRSGFDFAAYIRYYRGNVRISQIESSFKVCERTLERDMNAAMGLSPKEYCKIIRFNNLLNYVSQNEQVNWFDMINRFGYHDQSHLIHEFKDATGLTPEIFLKYRNKRIFKIDNHLVLIKPNTMYTEVHSTLASAEESALLLSDFN